MADINIFCGNRYTAAILQAHADVLCQSLNLSSIVVVNASKGAVCLLGYQGGYVRDVSGAHCIYIDTTKGHIVQALAHEMRHAYQTEHDTLGPYDWSIPYCDREHERDAVAYATGYVASL